jgi:hypothetical protein
MPILGQRDMIEALTEPIDDRHHRIAVGDRECAARAKIVLHVDYQQQIIVVEPGLHGGRPPDLPIRGLAADRFGRASQQKRRTILRTASIISQPARLMEPHTACGSR